ncbi:MAG TPA: ABC transporter permease [Daejeonella sp.]|uniref:ABC transporter permease n=1 Tax=Daejeonella sp. TaxID=2805397 RepID=UPI002ED95CCE
MNKFLKISIRHLWQSRLYSSINILGLATAITCMLLAVIYWRAEHSFDDFHKNNPNLFRITTTLIENKNSMPSTFGATGQVQGKAFKDAVPEIKSFVRIMGGDIMSDIISKNKTLRARSLYVDETFFEVFTFPLIHGNPETALTNVNSVVITESMARKFFNRIDVIGENLQIDADPSFKRLGKPLIVTGVVQDPPENSSIQFDVLFSFKFMELSFEDTNWLNAYLGTFVVLHPDANRYVVGQKFDKVFALHAKEQLAQNFKTYAYDPQISYGLQAITDTHLKPLTRGAGGVENGVLNGSSEVYSYMFMAIAFFILLMAAINFINITIATSLKRSKEVGVRKIVGGSKEQIVMQFLQESAILCSIAFLLAFILMNFSLPLFNTLTGKQIFFSEVMDLWLLCSFILLLISIVLLTGFYPAYILSQFKPSEVLYNKGKLSGRNVFGSALVIVQFSMTVFLLISTIVYYGQMDYIRTKDLGYNPDNVIRTAVNGARDYRAVIQFLKNEIAREPAIKMISFGNDGMVEDLRVNGQSFKSQYKNVDENFIPALNIPLKAGRNLSLTFAKDIREGVLVNEAFVKAAGLQNPVGQTIRMDRYYENEKKTIVGVVKDFHFGSLHEKIKPMVMYMAETPDGGMWVKFEKSRQKEAIIALERIYKQAMPNAIYQYSFLDELNESQYQHEQRWQQLINIATILSLIICCLGLFGLAHLSTKRQLKDIGIRKVLGASVSQVVILLSAEFLKLVLIAFVIAAPLAGFIMSKWLQDFAYRVTIGPEVFIISGSIVVIVAFAAVSFQSVKAALANPVNSLRAE